MTFKKYSTLAIAVFAAAGLMMSGCAKKTVEGSGDNGMGKNTAGTNGTVNPTPAVDVMAGIPAERSVYFAFDKSNISSAAAAILDANAKWLASHPERTATVEGNCDQRGSREYNLALGQRRADSVKAYLVAHGVKSANITTASFGKENPVCRGTGEACWSQNRRADIVVR